MADGQAAKMNCLRKIFYKITKKKEKYMKLYLLIFLFLTFSLSSTSALAEKASKESIKLLMERTGTGNLGMQMMNQMIPALKKTIPDAPEKFWADILKEIDANQIIEMVIPVYQKYFSAQDILELNSFYNTAVGKKLIKVQPAIMQESMAMGQQWGQEVAHNVIQKYKKQSEKNHNEIIE